jgi:excisionase family DNA binding protein
MHLRPAVDRAARDAGDGERAWLSLGPASSLVGVDPDTLRRWADDGRIRAFATPGGHRRFDRRDLEQLVESRRGRRRSLAALGATPDRLTRAYARSYRDGEARSRLGQRFDLRDRAAFRDEGRRLVRALLAYLDTDSTRGRQRWEAEAAEAVGATGARLAASGATVVDAVSTFIAARRPFLAALGAIGRRRALDAVAVTVLYEDAAALLDRLLLQLVTSFAQPNS